MNKKNDFGLVTVSLDQVAISFLASLGEVAPAWPKIKTLLMTGVDAGKLVCPIPPETVWESTPLSESRNRRVRELQSRLSRGVSFKSFSRLLSEEVLALVRPEVDITPWEPGDWDNLRDRLIGSASRNEFLNFKNGVEEQIDSLSINYENQGLRLAELERFINKKQVFDLYRNLERLNAGQPLAPTCPFTAEVCEYLRDSSISREEIENLKKLALQHKYETIPILFYYNRLVTQFEFDLLHGGRRPEANDVDDLTRAATALWASRIYVCDAEIAELCKKAKTNQCQSIPTSVLSARQPELFLKCLESIL